MGQKKEDMKVKFKYNLDSSSNATSGFATLFAILGGACCWGPLFFSVIGIGASGGGILGSAASFLGAIAPYRNYFLILNIIGVLLSFYFIYIMPKMLSKSVNIEEPKFHDEPMAHAKAQAGQILQSNISAKSNVEKCDCETKASLRLNKIVFFISLIITAGMFLYLYIDTGQIFTAWTTL
ncbi:MAG: hypothetical protein EVG15_09285 [Candidatus Acididesulfobacter diazotrophicus]|jgi:hypothetical protein|uniref:Mercuric transport protein MerT n=1 Tax=Candidatus Acididesulfobacter diazotrophicus TaxID=2597226 RepID=A0A519BKI2_9DELT|nr:MAG: hypothetical protein EVG15_09285 [Candidatus Acididesulfobacter diazotrophicus]